ncbi:ThiF family adenylyltransferase [Marichromatium bheemlicum]|uniref:ThiF family adenylyltransferase n=1 Tax=Marichromatium bheemlicum TaxID=365339 RepID=UPI002483D399|nr:ThiF family adenylyltransferase [Marichromatium bheemlicum]
MASVLPSAVARAVATIREHPAVENLSLSTGNETTAVVASFRVSMPSRWLAEGHSPSGVRPVEPVTLRFPANYPLCAPSLELRNDFSRSHPHINPGPEDDPPVPCVVEGSLTELLHASGLESVLNQISAWLDNAANGTLIDPKQGWEPVRRDTLTHVICADAGVLYGRTDGQERPWFVGCNYWYERDKPPGILIALGSESFPLARDTLGRLMRHGDSPNGIALGQSLGLVAGPAKGPDGSLPVCCDYLPESVATLADLRQRAAAYGCAAALNTGLKLLRDRLLEASTTARKDYPLVLPIVLLAKRPFPLIGTESPIELIPYVVSTPISDFCANGDAVPVEPASHVHTLSRNLLRRLSGVEDMKTPKPWTLLGAGSLGSNVAISLGRMGDGPSVTVDNDYFSPHNAARHALLPDNASGMGLLGNKAFALQQALLCLAQNTEALSAHVLDVLADPKLLKKAVPRNAWAVVNATASLAVRDALMEAAPKLHAPVIEAAIWGRGAAATLLVESTDGNPNVGDMVAALYERARSDSALSNALLPGGASHALIETGQGCRSSTMAMPDAVVSQFASAMSLAIADLRRDGLPMATGHTWIGLRQGIQVQWQQIVVQPSERIKVEASPWTIRIGADAHQAISEDINRFPGVETGGVLMGRISEATHTFYVTGIVPAPESSVRRADCFILETKGLKRAVERYSEETAGALYCLGTWHSHLTPSGPSALDRQTAEVLKEWRVAPSVMLIRHPSGYQASITEGIWQ